MKDYIYQSSLAKHLQGFIDYKRALGYKYAGEAYTISRFDKYWQESSGSSEEITKAAIDGWLARRPGEGVSSRSARVSVIRQLMIYLNGMGINAYIPTDKTFKSHPVVHVLSMDEISELFRVIDTYMPKRYPVFFIRMREEYKVIFRLILTTGLRRTEAVTIKIQDVDWQLGTITIYNAKGNKDRLIYMADDMLAVLAGYRKFLADQIGKEPEWLFPSFKVNEHVSAAALGTKFKSYWKMTSYADKCEKDPTIHALRHTYVVVRMNRWIAQDVNVNVMLPYLSRQLGHKSPSETFYYYHQVKDAFRIIRRKDTMAPAVLPEVRIR